jgi:5-methylcytosine-specific restriction endonuclease McrA
MTKREYREVYLRSDHWRQMRAAALDRADNRCQVCNGADALDVHHRTYERLGAELPGDLTVLCRRCHGLFHAAIEPRTASRPAKADKALGKRQRKAQRKAANRPGAHAAAMAQMRARNEARG